MIATQFSEVIDSFHSIIMDKQEIPASLEMMWLKKAIAEYGVVLSPLEYNEEAGEFTETISQYIIDTLATMMKVMYLQRHYSKVNKIASIVGRDLSVNGTNGLQKYTKDELEIVKADLAEKISNLKPTAYS